MPINQVFLFIFSASAIWFVSQKKDYKKWGYVIGLLGQPFWFYSAIENKQLGIFLLTIFYTYSWSLGIYNYFIKKEKS